jgi:hypothetical protein
MPMGKRLLISVGPVLFSAALSAGGAVLGTMQAFSAEINKLHEEDIRIRSAIQERTTLREQQMTEFRSLCTDAHSRIAVLELRQRGLKRLDLGGVNTTRSAGLARFKIGTGGQVLRLAGTYLA